MQREVRDALLRMVADGQVVKSDISRGSISEVTVRHAGNTLTVTWYPSFGPFDRGRLRTLIFNGNDTPLYSRYATDVLRAMQDLAEREFDRRAVDILNRYPETA